MENLLAFPEALLAVLNSQPNMRDFVPSALNVNDQGDVWVGLIRRNAAPLYAGSVTCRAVSKTVLGVSVEITRIRPGKHDFKIEITGPRSANFYYNNSPEPISMSMEVTPGHITYSHQSGVQIEQWTYRKEVRFWVSGLPSFPHNVAVHLAFK